MKTYSTEAKEIWELVKTYKEVCTYLDQQKKFYTPDEMRKACKRTWPDFDIEFLPKEQAANFDWDTDCIFGGPKLFEQVFKASHITLGEPLTDEQVLKSMADQWFFIQSVPLAGGGSPCLMVPRSRANDSVNDLTFYALNARIHYTKPTNMNLGQFLSDSSLRDQLTNLGEVLLLAARNNGGHATEESYLQAARDAMMDYASGSKRGVFIALVEKTRQTLFNILMDKNAHSSNPVPHLDQQLKTKDKKPIYKLAARKNLIPSADKMIYYQDVRDYIKHPDEVPYQEFPDDEDVINTFTTITERLGFKPPKLVSLMVPSNMSTSQLQTLAYIAAMVESRKSGLPLSVKEFYVGNNQNMVDMAVADEQSCIVDQANRFVSKLTPEYDSAGKKIRRNKKLEYLLSEQILDATQRQELGDSIHHRNNLSHGHANDVDTQAIIDPTAQETLRKNTLVLMKKYLDSKTKGSGQP